MNFVEAYNTDVIVDSFIHLKSEGDDSKRPYVTVSHLGSALGLVKASIHITYREAENSSFLRSYEI